MRNISFALTWDQILAETKTVTRRLGWRRLPPGTMLQPVKKGQGLKKGEKVVRGPKPILGADVRRERLDRMLTDREYGLREVEAEGFPHLSPKEFVAMFCNHNGCQPWDEVTRIEFEYVDAHRTKARPSR